VCGIIHKKEASAAGFNSLFGKWSAQKWYLPKPMEHLDFNLRILDTAPKHARADIFARDSSTQTEWNPQRRTANKENGIQG